jgi:hypothetical protein
MSKTILGVAAMCWAGVNVQAQTIAVTSPNGGQNWTLNTTQTIAWTASGLTADRTLSVVLRQNGVRVGDIATGLPPTSGSLSWTVGSYQGGQATPGSGYKILVRAGPALLDESDGAFTISNFQVVHVPTHDVPAGVPFKFPALVIYQAGMVPYDDKFEVTFGYKNSGSGPLPKNSEMPVKPNFRVLVDNREVNHGDLFIPAFPAEPGWGVPTFSACAITRQTMGPFDPSIYVGNELKVIINENKVNGMASSSQTYSLRTMALNYSYDIAINQVTLDWSSSLLTALVRLEGVFRANDEIELWDDKIIHLAGYDWWHITARAQPGQHLYTLSRKVDGLKGQNSHPVALRVSLKRSSDPALLHKDIDHRNNQYDRVFSR